MRKRPAPRSNEQYCRLKRSSWTRSSRWRLGLRCSTAWRACSSYSPRRRGISSGCRACSASARKHIPSRRGLSATAFSSMVSKANSAMDSCQTASVPHAACGLESRRSMSRSFSCQSSRRLASAVSISARCARSSCDLANADCLVCTPVSRASSASAAAASASCTLRLPVATPAALVSCESSRRGRCAVLAPVAVAGDRPLP